MNVLWGLPYSPLGDLFKGRDASLDKLRHVFRHDATGSSTVCALHGKSGVGKTRLAVEYAWRCKANYSAIFYVSSETPRRLQEGIARLAAADVLNLAEGDANNDEKIVAVLRWLNENSGWLLICDSVDHKLARDEVRSMLLLFTRGHVLVVGRLENYAAGQNNLGVDVLTPAHAAEFLLARTGRGRNGALDDAEGADALGRELGGLPLALELAGAHMVHERLSFARSLALWRDASAEMYGWFDSALVAYDRGESLDATWKPVVDALPPQAHRLWLRLGFLAPDPIPSTLFDVSVEGREDFDAREALADLLAASMLKPTQMASGEPGFLTHPIVKGFSKWPEPAAQIALLEAIEWMDAAFSADFQDSSTWPMLEQLVPHALAVTRQGADNSVLEVTARLMNHMGLFAHYQGRNGEAELLQRRALALNERAYGLDHPEVAISLGNLAGTLRETNQEFEAERVLRRALEIDETTATDDSDVAERLYNLGAVLRATGQLAEAEAVFWRSLKIYEQHVGADHPDVAHTLCELASVLQYTHRPVEAERMFRRGILLMEKGMGPDHCDTGIALANLALLLKQRGQLNESETLYQRAITIMKAWFGPDHPRVQAVAVDFANLLYAKEHRIETALHSLMGSFKDWFARYFSRF